MILILIKNNEQIEKDKYLNQKHKKQQPINYMENKELA